MGRFARIDGDSAPGEARYDARMLADRPQPFARGDAVVLRGIRTFGRHGLAVGYAVAGVVVVDGPELSVLCTPSGSGVLTRAGVGSGPNARLVLSDDWDGSHDAREWHGSVVRVHRAGEPWSVWRWHDGENWVGDWYGNLETPWRRAALGFESQDWALDVVGVGDPTGDDWRVRFKDEDELAFLVQAGEVTADKATTIAEAGDRLAAVARERRWPFDADWSGWVPNAAWDAVPMPPDATRLDD